MERHRSDSTDDPVYRTLVRDVRLLPVLLASTVGTLGTNVASPALPAIANTLAVSDSQIGLVISLYSLMAMVSVPFTGVLADIYGRRTVLIPSLFVYGLSGTAIAFVGSFEAILALRAAQGVAFAAIMPLSVTLLGDLYDGPTGSAAQGLRVGSNGLANIVVPAVAGFLAGVSWNFPFLIFLFCFPIAVLTYWYLPETANNDVPGHGIVETALKYGSEIRTEVKDVNLGVLLFGEFVRDVVRYALFAFIPLFAVRVLDAPIALAGMILAVRGIVGMVIGPLSGAIVAYFSRKQALIAAMALSAGCVAAVPFVTNVLLLGVLVGVYAIGDTLFSPVIKDAVTALASDERRGGIVSGMNMLKYAGQTASTAVFGVVLAVWGFESIFLLAALVGVAYAVILSVTISSDV